MAHDGALLRYLASQFLELVSFSMVFGKKESEPDPEEDRLETMGKDYSKLNGSGI